jgi:hypothetical protein
MIWWGYAGFSGAVVFSLALLAAIMGLRTETVLSLVAQSGASLLAFGAVVHVCAIGMRRRPKLPPSAALLREPVAQAAAPKPAADIGKLKPIPRKLEPGVPVPALQPVH